MPELNEFLNPRSMLTPGLAGGLTMVISGTLWVHFGLPQKWTALAISLAISLLVVRGKNIPLWERIIYYGLNTMFIFSMGLGAHTAVSGG
jgi:hypothetical protein